MDIPEPVLDLARRCHEAGGRALLVGGGVRDFLLGRPFKDWDVEVYGVPEDRLVPLLERVGQVNAVGRSFGVFKVTAYDHGRREREIDVSIPRRDSKVGPGHKGIRVEGDPKLEIREAARRRDLTVNAILYDPLTGEYLDPWGGKADLETGVLRAVDAETFLEDPLRALRAVQFVARLGFTPDPGLVALCRQAPLDELPPERVQGEWLKLLLEGKIPSAGLKLAREAAILSRVFPRLVDAPEVADPALDRLAATRYEEVQGRTLAIRLGVWLHATPPDGVIDTMDRLRLHTWGNYPLRERVLQVVACWREDPATDAEIRRGATRTEWRATLLARHAITQDPAALSRLERARELNAEKAKVPAFLQGRHLQALGMAPGPRMGEILKSVYERQLDGEVGSEAEAVAAARALIGP